MPLTNRLVQVDDAIGKPSGKSYTDHATDSLDSAIGKPSGKSYTDHAQDSAAPYVDHASKQVIVVLCLLGVGSRSGSVHRPLLVCRLRLRTTTPRGMRPIPTMVRAFLLGALAPRAGDLC